MVKIQQNKTAAKRVIIIISLFIASIFSAQAQELCNTLKIKTIGTYYGNINGTSFRPMGSLDGAVINIDTLSFFHLGLEMVNISNDIFYSNETSIILLYCIVHADARSKRFSKSSGSMPFFDDYRPNDIWGIATTLNFDLQDIINAAKEEGIDFEDITHWEYIAGISYTSTDGTYSDSIFYAGADTAIFRVVKGGVGVVETGRAPSLQVFPNPANGQLTISLPNPSKGGAYTAEDIEIYDVVGQKVLAPLTSLRGELEPSSNAGNFPLEGGLRGATIDISHLANGMYFLRVGGKR